MYRTNSLILVYFRDVNFNGSNDVHVSNARQFILFMIMKLGIVFDVLGEDRCFEHELFLVFIIFILI